MRTGARVSTLAAHADFSFAAAWHPSGQLLATGVPACLGKKGRAHQRRHTKRRGPRLPKEAIKIPPHACGMSGSHPHLLQGWLETWGPSARCASPQGRKWTAAAVVLILVIPFPADGKYLAAAEPADFVHIYDVASDFKRAQLVRLNFENIKLLKLIALNRRMCISAVCQSINCTLAQSQKAFILQLATALLLARELGTWFTLLRHLYSILCHSLE
eukprot:516691-Pelagomonas_calceolata.AAC.5